MHAVDIAAIDWEPDGAAAAGQHRTLPMHVTKEEVYAAFRAETRGQSYVDTTSVFWQNSLRLFDDTVFFEDKRVQTDAVPMCANVASTRFNLALGVSVTKFALPVPSTSSPSPSARAGVSGAQSVS